jgi:arylsulfatase
MRSLIFSSDETTDVGFESASPVAEDYDAQTSKFNGLIQWVQIDLGTDDADHLISPEERLRVAMARQ